MAMQNLWRKKGEGEKGGVAVSVVLPVCQSGYSLRKTVESVIGQGFDAWELLIVCGQGISEDNAKMARDYAGTDQRIRVLDAPQSYELSGCLNTGIEAAKGRYVALIACGDISDARRLKTQYAYMEENPTVGVSQFYQRRVGGGERDFLHCPPVSAPVMKAKLLFFCDICFSTVMIRKSVVEESGIRFDPEAKFPEHVFWFRMAQVTDFETIPLIYGATPEGSDPFPVRDDDAAQAEMCEMAGRLINEKLDELDFPPEKWYLLGGRVNFYSAMDKDKKIKTLLELCDYMFDLWKENLVPAYWPSPGMRVAIAKLWRWARYDEPWEGETKPRHIGESLELQYRSEDSFLTRYLKRLLRPVVEEYRYRRKLKKSEALAAVLRDSPEAQEA